MLLLSSVSLVSLTLVAFLGPTIVLGVNDTKVCCPPFDKRVESDGKVFCFATVTIPDNRAAFGNYLCRNLHPHAKLASFHSATELNVVYNLGRPGITGLVYEFDEFIWRDGTPVNFTQWAYGHPGMNSSEAAVEVNAYLQFSTITLQGSTSRTVYCKMEAEHTECPECESCILFKTDKDTFCYKQIDIGYGIAAIEYAVDNNICAQNSSGYDLASIHSKEENDFIYDNFNRLSCEPMIIGLRIPKSKRGLPISNDLFEWTDGTPVDYNEWEDVNSTLTAVYNPVNQYQRRTCVHTNTPLSFAWLLKINGLWCTDFYNVYHYGLCKKRVKCHLT